MIGKSIEGLSRLVEGVFVEVNPQIIQRNLLYRFLVLEQEGSQK